MKKPTPETSSGTPKKKDEANQKYLQSLLKLAAQTRGSLGEGIVPQSQGMDAEDMEVGEEGSQVEAGLLENGSQTLQRIIAAIGRVREGTFGVCMECDHAIAKSRLDAVPYAELCIGCQRTAEEAASASGQELDYSRLARARASKETEEEPDFEQLRQDADK